MIELFIALGAGLISFLSPCVLPLIPGYISFISGQSLNELIESKKINLVPLFLFSLGFSFVFIIFGATASVLGKFLLQNSVQLRIAAGLIIIIFSLQLLGIINIKFLNYEKKYYTRQINQTIIYICCWYGFWIWMDPLHWSYFGIYFGIGINRGKYFKSYCIVRLLFFRFSYSIYTVWFFNTKIFSIFKKFQKKYQQGFKDRWNNFTYNWYFDFNKSITNLRLLYFKYFSFFSKFWIVLKNF